jgi:hypothetical protein
MNESSVIQEGLKNGIYQLKSPESMEISFKTEEIWKDLRRILRISRIISKKSGNPEFLVFKNSYGFCLTKEESIEKEVAPVIVFVNKDTKICVASFNKAGEKLFSLLTKMEFDVFTDFEEAMFESKETKETELKKQGVIFYELKSESMSSWGPCPPVEYKDGSMDMCCQMKRV